MLCIVNCFSKHYRFLAYSNALYTYLVKGQDVEDHIKDNYEDFNVDIAPDEPPLNRAEATVKALGGFDNVKASMANKLF